MLNIRGWQKESFIEWPGKICSIIWLAGCNFACPWCSNLDLVKNPQTFPLYKEKKILEHLKLDRLLDGLMITGGEPLRIDSQVLGIENFIKKVRKIGLLVGIETNGSNPQAIKKLINEKLVDFWSMDIKAPLKEEKYSQVIGVKADVEKIKKSIKLIMSFPGESEFKTTLVPEYLKEEDILEIARELKEISQNKGEIKRYVLQRFDPKLAKGHWQQSYSPEEIKNLAQSCRKYIKNVKLRL